MKTRAFLPIVVTLLAAVAMSSASAGQPNMQNALGHLRAARAALVKAEANKAGHRERAIDLVNQAIHQVEEGMAAAR